MTGQLDSTTLLDFKVNFDLSIPFPRYCCANKLLELKCTQSGPKWVADIERKVQEVARNFQFPMELRDSQPCSMCFKPNFELSNKPRRASSRKDSGDNYLYFPTIQGETLEHFQKHWRRK